jgi:hypothetical protein
MRKAGRKEKDFQLHLLLPAFLPSSSKNPKDQNLNKERRKVGKRFSMPPIPSCIPAILIKKSKRPEFE